MSVQAKRETSRLAAYPDTRKTQENQILLRIRGLLRAGTSRAPLPLRNQVPTIGSSAS